MMAFVLEGSYFIALVLGVTVENAINLLRNYLTITCIKSL